MASKLLEHIIHSHVMKHLEQHNILTDSQHGFRAKRSTETQLIQTIHDISKSLDKKEIVDMAILDFTQAFDKVPNKRLIHKLNSSSSTINHSYLRCTPGNCSWATTFPSLHKRPTYPQVYGSLQMIAFYTHLSEHKMTLP